MRLLHPEVRDLEPDDLFDLYDEPGPYLRAGFVTTVDGVIAIDGTSAALSSPADKAVFRALRTVADAVVVGAGTVRSEDYGPVRLPAAGINWRSAHGRAAEVPLVVVSRTGDLGSGRVLEGPVLLSAPKGPPGVELLPTEPAALVEALHERGLTRLLCEGGPSLLTTLLEAQLVNELCLTTSPHAAGEGPHLLGELRFPRELELTHLIHEDPGVLLARWSVVRSVRD